MKLTHQMVDELRDEIKQLETTQNSILERIALLELIAREPGPGCPHSGSYIDTGGWHCPVCNEHNPI